MLISCCGNRCDECEQYPEQCPGCAAIGGKAAWCASLEVEVCPFVTCAAETGVAHCGECGEFPCELYELTLSEDAGEEERRAFSMARYRNFGPAGCPAVFGKTVRLSRVGRSHPTTIKIKEKQVS